MSEMRKGVSPMRLLEKAKQYANGVVILTEWLGDGADTVPKEQAQARANVCLKCPMNVREFAFPETVAAVIRKQVEIKNKINLRLNGEKSLHTCSGCGCVIKLKCWLKLDRLGLDADGLVKFDQSCWLRKEFKP